jgi:hypothetical protein
MARRRPRQGHFKGMEPPDSPELTRLAIHFLKRRSDWQKAHPVMMAAKRELQLQMKKEGLTQYDFNLDGVDYRVTLDQTADLHVGRIKRERANNQE